MVDSGETTAMLQVPIYPLVYYMALLTALAALLGVLLAARREAGASMRTGAKA